MKHIACCLLVLPPALACAADGVQLTQRSRSYRTIVQATEPTQAEAFAAAELADFIKQSTGADLAVVKESDFSGEHAIYVGQTRFAGKSGIDFAKLGPEEWIIRSVDGSVILSGGRPRGTLYSVYEFLERFVGIRFLTAHSTHVPKNADLRIPAALSVRDAPALFRREILMVVSGHGPPEHKLFQVRRKINSFANAHRRIEPKFGHSVIIGSPYSTHTHHRYTKDFPTDKPELFALTEKGTRTGPGPQGQVCMCNPEVRKLFAAKMRQYIRQDREKTAEVGTGAPFPTVYDITPNDNRNKCVCDKCMALAEKYGAYSGVVQEFTNHIARDIAKDYPEILVQTGAYTFYAAIPQGIKPRGNVMIRIAQLGAEFTVALKRDTLRSLAHPVNSKAHQVFKEWSKLAKTLGVHDYWTAWSQRFRWPHANIHGLAETLKLYHRYGVRDFLVEDELMGTRIHNFVDLQFYLGSKLLVQPEQDAQRIIDEFMSLYYGKAAPVMKRLLAYIETRQEEQPGPLASVPPAARRYLDVAFFIDVDAMLSEAEQLAAAEPKTFANIRQERMPVDEAMLHLWRKLASGADGKWPFKRNEVLQRLQANYEAAYKKYGGWGAKLKKNDDLRLEYLRRMPPIPPQFRGKNIIDICGPQLSLGAGSPARVVADPDAAVGTAWRLDSSMKGHAGNHEQFPVFGLYDNKSRALVKQVIIREEMPKDEKYHLHLAGRMKATPTQYFWAHHSWRLSQRLGMAYNSALPEQPTYDVYASIKVEGPAHVPGSSRTNAFSVDRLILVEVAEPR